MVFDTVEELVKELTPYVGQGRKIRLWDGAEINCLGENLETGDVLIWSADHHDKTKEQT